MTPDDTTLDNNEFVGTDQAGDEAGDQPTSGNDDEQVEDSHNDQQDDELEDDERGEPDESDETTAPLARARSQAARYRRQLRETEAALWAERVAALGVLADPDDLEFDAEALHDPDRLRELADELVTRKPHLRSRRIRQRAGQGIGDGDGGVNLAAMLARGA